MQESGFATGMIGKYHVGHSLQPSECGLGSTSAYSKTGTFVRASLLADSKQRSAQSCQTIGNQSCIAASIRRHAGFDHVADVYYDNDALTFFAHQPEWMAHEAVRFLRSAKRRRKPFFLWMAPSLTHSPADVARQLTSEPRYGPAGCSDDGSGDSSATVALFKASARRTRASVLARLSKYKLLCSRLNATDWRVCTDEKLPQPSTLLRPEPWLPAEWFNEPNAAGAGRRAGLATSVALAAWLDASLAPLFAEIRNRSAAAEQTLTIFTSDHGPYFAGKGHAYEAGVRVPLILNWFNGPASLAGRTIQTRVTHLDVMPTLAAMIGGSTSMPGDGYSFAELLNAVASNNPPLALTASPLVIEVGFSRSIVLDGYKLMLHLLPPSAASDIQCRSIHGIKLPASANRNESGGVVSKASKIKFVYDVRERHPVHHCDRVQLYDLSSDPAEQHNLASKQPTRVSAMTKLVFSHIASVETASPAPKHSGPNLTAVDVADNRTLREGVSPSTAQKRVTGAAPRSWCQDCHPSTDCAAWPNEWSKVPEEAEPKLDSDALDHIRGHADSLIAAMGSNVGTHAIEQMLRMTRAEPYAPREKCVLLRAVDGRVLIDWLDTDYAHQRDFSIASCYPSKKGNYLRSRFHIALRLILRALRRLGPLPAFEIGFCPDDCSPALSSTPQATMPLLTSVSCAGRRTLPFVAWTVNSNRATDLGEWDVFIDEWARKAQTVPWREREAKAVFRGHLRPFTVCGNWPDAGAPQYNEPVGADNWRVRGRSAVWAARIAHPELLDVNFDNRAEMASLWQLSAAEAASVDQPPSISMEEQARRFRYVIHPEGQCGFADRLKSIMALPMLVLKQANPCAEWYEGLLAPGIHYVPVDGSYANLSSAVSWARTHDESAQQIASAGHARIRQVVSVPGVYAYADRLMQQYAERFIGAGGRSGVAGNYTHEFSCREVRNEATRTAATECRLSGL